MARFFGIVGAIHALRCAYRDRWRLMVGVNRKWRGIGLRGAKRVVIRDSSAPYIVVEDASDILVHGCYVTQPRDHPARSLIHFGKVKDVRLDSIRGEKR